MSDRYGSQANILSFEVANALNIMQMLKDTKIRIFTLSKERIPVLGTVDLNFTYDIQNFVTKCFVVNFNCKNIIRIESAVNMDLINNIIEKHIQ